VDLFKIILCSGIWGGTELVEQFSLSHLQWSSLLETLACMGQLITSEIITLHSNDAA
jgi:hypothetical protein